MAVENDVILVPGSKSTRSLCRGVEIDLILKWGSELTLFQCRGQNELDFCVGDRN